MSGESLPGTPAIDQLQRPLHDLRVSVTDRCNFRCVYCMPREIFGRRYTFLEHKDILTFEEIARLVRVLKPLGLRKVRLTGGEPLVRKHLERLVGMLAELGSLDLALTTNGALLATQAQALRDAGLRRVTVSLDTLDDALFRRMNDTDVPVQQVLEGIEAAVSVGLAPVKINMVVKRGVNEDSLLPMAERFRNRGHILRFIEFMDVGQTNGWRLDEVVPASEVLSRLHAAHPLEPLEANYPGEVASRWRYRDGAGEIGVIASVTSPFCRGCTRMRLSADGSFYTCLFAGRGHSLRDAMRGGASDEEIAGAVRTLWQGRTDRYSELRSSATADLPKVEMSFIGG
jgi:cyclic pyranopterin phosphate synthase